MKCWLIVKSPCLNIIYYYLDEKLQIEKIIVVSSYHCSILLPSLINDDDIIMQIINEFLFILFI